jgi:hypothetical protein
MGGSALRGQFSSWPRRARVLAVVSAAVIAGTVIVHAATAGTPRHFPGQYMFSGDYGSYDFPTTVSVGQAFHDHGFVPPHGIINLRYAADSPGYSWPYAFVAVFSFPCDEASGFVKASNLQYGGTGPNWPVPDIDVMLFARAQGWREADKLTRWYYRAVPDAPAVYEEVMIVGRAVCTAYLTNNN